jgi:hypothetical protein
MVVNLYRTCHEGSLVCDVIVFFCAKCYIKVSRGVKFAKESKFCLPAEQNGIKMPLGKLFKLRSGALEIKTHTFAMLLCKGR